MADEIKYTASELLKSAAEQLRNEFNTIRKTVPHYGEAGEEVEKIVIEFLNNYLPKRFRASSGFILDSNNQISRQCDVIVYDQLLSPIYRASNNALILPNHHVAAVVEVKSKLSKSQLKDSLDKIQIAKSLNKPEPTSFDLPSTGSPLKTYKTLGIVFAFDSETTLETIGDNLAEMHKSVDSNHWIDFILVLNQGVIEHQIQYFGDLSMRGTWMPPTAESFIIPPFYIHLLLKQLKEYSLNWFLAYLNSHLSFFAMRPTYSEYGQLMEGSTNLAMTLQGYQIGLDRKIHPAPEEEYVENRPQFLSQLRISNKNGQLLGMLSYHKWVDGCVIHWTGTISANEFMGAFVHSSKCKMIVVREYPLVEVSTVMNFTLDDFKKWHSKLHRFTKGDLKATII